LAKTVLGLYADAQRRQEQAAMPRPVTSAANPAAKLLRALEMKKTRVEERLFRAEGVRIVTEALDLGHHPAMAAVTEEGLARPTTEDLVVRLEAAGVDVMVMPGRLMESIARRDNVQTLLAAFPIPEVPLEDLPIPADGLFVVLDRPRDPGNLGTILRTADCVGAHGIILIGDACDPWSVEAVRASMGSIFALPVVHADLASVTNWCKAHDVSLIGTTPDTQTRFDEPDVAGAIAVVMGNEQSGISDAVAAACDSLVRIPMQGRADSLNLAVSTAVMLFDIWRRRGYANAR
jgi:RNA methyltransferase, TrmH family